LLVERISKTCKNTRVSVRVRVSVEGEQAGRDSKRAVTEMGKSTIVIG
jgi:hypothetical protein